MKHQRTPRFKEDYKALPAEIQEATRKAFQLFKENPRHPSLRVKLMQPKKRGIWEGHITLGYVFTLHWDTDAETGEQIAVFRRIGKHDEIYCNP
ncbi:MAG: hypothetical protein ABI700_11965 [Chloroflexota bacterium]